MAAPGPDERWKWRRGPQAGTVASERGFQPCLLVSPLGGSGAGVEGIGHLSLSLLLPSSLPPGPVGCGLSSQPPRAQCRAGKGGKGRLTSGETNFLRSLKNVTD